MDALNRIVTNFNQPISRNSPTKCPRLSLLALARRYYWYFLLLTVVFTLKCSNISSNDVFIYVYCECYWCCVYVLDCGCDCCRVMRHNDDIKQLGQGSDSGDLPILRIEKKRIENHTNRKGNIDDIVIIRKTKCQKHIPTFL